MENNVLDMQFWTMDQCSNLSPIVF